MYIQPKHYTVSMNNGYKTCNAYRECTVDILPEPVTAQAQRSLPFRATGIQADCIGVGCTKFIELNAFTRGLDKFMSANVNFSSYVSMHSSNCCFSGYKQTEKYLTRTS